MSSEPVVRPCWVEQSVTLHATKLNDEKRRKPKTVTPFPKWDIDMTNNFVTSLDYAHIHKSIMYVTKR